MKFIRKIWHFRLFASTGILLAFSALLICVFAQNDKKSLQNKKSRLEKEIQETNNELEKTKKSKSANLQQLVLINKKINKREELIGAIEQEVGDIDYQIARFSDTIYQLNTSLSKLKEEYSRIIYSTYRNRSAFQRLMFIFASDNFQQAYKRLKYLKQYTEYRKKQLLAINNTRATLSYRKLDLEIRKSSKLSLKHIQENERNNLTAEKAEKDKKIKNLTSQEKKLLKKIHDNEAAVTKLQNAIATLVAAEIRKANEEKARRAAELAENEAAIYNKSSASTVGKTAKTEPIASLGKSSRSEKPVRNYTENMSVSAEDIALTGNFAANKGKLPSPIDKGTIISSFGEHPHAEFHNIKIKNNGVDLTSAQGARAKAVFDGEVSSVIFITNLNFVVILRHGDYLTVYSNLVDVSVKKGDKISIRDPLGTLFTAPGESRSRLHFELWHGTTLLNPASWLNL